MRLTHIENHARLVGLQVPGKAHSEMLGVDSIYLKRFRVDIIRDTVRILT